MVNRFRSGRRFPDALNRVQDLDTQQYLDDLVRAIYDLEADVPYLPVNKTSFVVEGTIPERYTVSASSTNSELVEVVSTLLTKLKDSGILL